MVPENFIAVETSDSSITGNGVRVTFHPDSRTITLYRLEGSAVIQMSKNSDMGYPVVGGDNIRDFTDYSCVVERNIIGILGIGERITITSHSPSTRLIRTYILEVSAAESGVVYTKTSYQSGDTAVDVSGYVDNVFELYGAKKCIWSYNGGGEGPMHYYDTLQKIDLTDAEKFIRENKHNSLAAGIPVADIYTAIGGIAVGDASVTRHEVHTPVYETNDSAQVSIWWPGKAIEAGASVVAGQSFVVVHGCDYFNGLRGYKNAMEHLGMVMLKNVPERSYELRWEGWGWQFEWTLDRIIGKLDELQAAGVKQITLDDGWYNAAGDWELNPEKFPNGEADMHRLVDAIHAHGMSALLWWRPCAAESHSKLYRDHPEYFVKNEDGSIARILSAVGNPIGENYALCPTSPGAIAATVKFIHRAMNEWHFDGFKGDYVWSNSKCYDESHHHPYPEESTERLADIYQAAREAMVADDPDAFNLLCNCGAPQDYYSLQYMTQIVTADPTSLDQTRRRVKAYKGLMGDYFPVTTDHSGIWYAATIGTGAVIIEKFDFTGEEEAEYERWMRIAMTEQLHKGRFVGDLYCYGFDPYETYVVEKNGIMYYAFYRDGIRYRPDGYPDIELKGLDPDKMYRIVDYVNDRVVATNLMGGNAVFNTRFADYLLVKAVEITAPDTDPVDQDWGFTTVEAKDAALVYSGDWHDNSDPVSCGGTCRRIGGAAASVEFTFAGTSVRWYGRKGADLGSAEVYLDGVLAATVNANGGAEPNVRLFEALDIGASVHTIKIVCKAGNISIDRIVYEAAIPEPIYEKVDALSDRIVYSGTWETEENEVFYAGKSRVTSEVGAAFEFTFQGTAIRWYGKRKLDFGIADLFLDGELADNVYSYGEPRMGQLLFERTGLPEGEHTIRVVHRSRTSDVDYLAYTTET